MNRTKNLLKTIAVVFSAQMIIGVGAIRGQVSAAPESKICTPSQRMLSSPLNGFDFIEGIWDVIEAEGDTVARVTVRRGLNGKALEMEWRSRGSLYWAHSFLGVDQERRWSQTWVDASTRPFFLFYHGGLENGTPTLYQTEMYHEDKIGKDPERSGYVCPRQRFTEITADSFSYMWEVSPDQGSSWIVQDRSRFRRVSR